MTIMSSFQAGKLPDARMNKRDVRKRFHRALGNLQQRSGWNAKELAAQYGLPHRSVLNWLGGSVCPGPRRVRELCKVFGWEYDQMFRRPSLEDLCESRPLTFRTLSRYHLSLQARDPLEAFNLVSLAGALVFNDLSTAGFECRAFLNSDFRTNIQFLLPALANVSLRIDVENERGLVIQWRDEHELIRETMLLSDSAMKSVKTNLRALTGH